MHFRANLRTNTFSWFDHRTAPPAMGQHPHPQRCTSAPSRPPLHSLPHMSWTMGVILEQQILVTKDLALTAGGTARQLAFGTPPTPPSMPTLQGGGEPSSLGGGVDMGGGRVHWLPCECTPTSPTPHTEALCQTPHPPRTFWVSMFFSTISVLIKSQPLCPAPPPPPLHFGPHFHRPKHIWHDGGLRRLGQSGAGQGQGTEGEYDVSQAATVRVSLRLSFQRRALGPCVDACGPA